MRLFIIGPGGVGKSTVGKILADILGYDFIDLDEEFCAQVENIGSFINSRGYETYCYENSVLFHNILNGLGDNFVFVLSSGFLVHEGLGELVSKHKKTIKENGLSVMILPSRSMDEGVDTIVKRQLSRGFGLNAEREREKYIDRFPKYEKMGDIKIFSVEEPEAIAEHVIADLNKITLGKEHGFKRSN